MFSLPSNSVPAEQQTHTYEEAPVLRAAHEPLDISIGAVEILDDGQMGTDENENNRCGSKVEAVSDDEPPFYGGRGLRSPLGFQNRGGYDDDYVDVEGGCGHGELDFDRLPSLLSIKIES